jgi:hypothetical protein
MDVPKLKKEVQEIREKLNEMMKDLDEDSEFYHLIRHAESCLDESLNELPRGRE